VATERRKVKNYVVVVDDNEGQKFASLKQARDYCRSVINISAVKGVETQVDIYKELITQEKLVSVVSKKDEVGSASTVFTGEF